jgi:hypothetical protein
MMRSATAPAWVSGRGLANIDSGPLSAKKRFQNIAALCGGQYQHTNPDLEHLAVKVASRNSLRGFRS